MSKPFKKIKKAISSEIKEETLPRSSEVKDEDLSEKSKREEEGEDEEGSSEGQINQYEYDGFVVDDNELEEDVSEVEKDGNSV